MQGLMTGDVSFPWSVSPEGDPSPLRYSFVQLLGHHKGETWLKLPVSVQEDNYRWQVTSQKTKMNNEQRWSFFPLLQGILQLSTSPSDPTSAYSISKEDIDIGILYIPSQNWPEFWMFLKYTCGL